VKNSNKYKLVREFHKKNNYATEDIRYWQYRSGSFILTWLSKLILVVVKLLQKKACKLQALGDCRLYRLLLILEESAEIGLALGDEYISWSEQEDLLADGLADLMYVTYGTAVTYFIPLDDVFLEVHRSNMSKKKKSDDDPRMRNKGDWSKPNIRGAIISGRGDLLNMIKESDMPSEQEYKTEYQGDWLC
jgi:hypothetical protein